MSSLLWVSCASAEVQLTNSRKYAVVVIWHLSDLKSQSPLRAAKVTAQRKGFPAQNSQEGTKLRVKGRDLVYAMHRAIGWLVPLPFILALLNSSFTQLS